MTFFDEREATAVGRGCAPPGVPPAPRLPPLVPALARRWDAALAARAAIRRDGAGALLLGEVDALVEALRPTVAQTQRINDALLTSSGPARDRLQARLDQLLDEIDQVVATLETVHAEILVAEQDELVAELRARPALPSTDTLAGQTRRALLGGYWVRGAEREGQRLGVGAGAQGDVGADVLRNVIATAALDTGPVQVAGVISTRSGSGSENVPLVRWPGSETLSVASPAVLMTLAVRGRRVLLVDARRRTRRSSPGRRASARASPARCRRPAACRAR